MRLPHTRDTNPSRTWRRLSALLLVLILGCLDGGTSTGLNNRLPIDAVTLEMAPELVTVGASLAAKLHLPSTLELVPGSVTWHVLPQSAAEVQLVPSRPDSVALALKAAGAITLDARFAVRGVGGGARGNDTWPSASRVVTRYVAARGVTLDSARSDGRTPLDISPRRPVQLVGISMDSSIIAFDGFADVHRATGRECAGFDWSVRGSGAVSFGTTSMVQGGAAANATGSNVGIQRAMVTLAPAIPFFTVAPGMDTLVLTHRGCTGACSDTLFLKVATTPRALRVTSAAAVTMQAGELLAAPVAVALIDANGEVATVDGQRVNATLFKGDAQLTGASAISTGGVAMFRDLRIGGKPSGYVVRFSSSSGMTTADLNVALTPGEPKALRWETSFPPAWVTGTPVVPCPLVRLIDAYQTPVERAGVAVVVRGSDGSVLATNTTDARGMAVLCGVRLTSALGLVTNDVSRATLTVAAPSLQVEDSVSLALGIGAPAVTVLPNALTLTAGSTAMLTASVKDAAGSVLAQTASWPAAFSFVSDNASVATVDSAGRVRGALTGTARIRAVAMGTSGAMTVTVVPGAASAQKSTAALSTPRVTAGDSLTVTLTLRDEMGNPVPSATPDLFVASAAGGRFGLWRCAGSACAASFTPPTAAGAHRLMIIIGGVALRDTASVIVTAGRAVALRDATGIASDLRVTAGTAVQQVPRVRVIDAYGNGVRGVRVTFVVTAGDGVIAPASPATITTDDEGVAALESWHVGGAAGMNAVSASSDGLDESPLEIRVIAVAGAATRLAFATPPSERTLVSVPFARQPVVVVTDPHGNVSRESTATVTLALTSGSGALAGTTAVTAINGVATFPELAINASGTDKVLTATATGLEPATTGPFTISTIPSASLAITATSASIPYAGATLLSTSGGSGTGAVTYAVTRGATVCALSGTTVTGIAVGSCTVTATKAADALYEQESATVDVTVIKANQVITFGNAPVIADGTQGTVSATASSSLPVSFTSTTGSICAVVGVTVTGANVGTCTIAANQAGNANYNAAPQATQSFAITVGAASRLALNTPADLVAGGSRAAYVVTRRDIKGNAVTSGDLTVTLLVNGTNGTFHNDASGGSAVTAVIIPAGSSSATFYFAATTAATYTITVKSNGLADGTDTIVVGVSAATGYTVGVSNYTPIAGTAVYVLAQLVDAYGNAVRTSGKTVYWTKSDARGAYGFSSTVTDAWGRAEVAFTTHWIAGTSTMLTATDGDNLTGTSAIVTTQAGAASKYVVTSSSTSPIAGAAVTITAQLADNNGNAVATTGRTVTWTKSNGFGSFSSSTSVTDGAGRATVTFTTHTVSGTSTTVTATDENNLKGTSAAIGTVVGVAAKYVVTANKYTQTPGTALLIVAQLADANGNAVAVANKTVTWSKSSTGGSFASATSVTDQNGKAMVAFTTPMQVDVTLTISATDGDNMTGTSPIITTVPAAMYALFRAERRRATVTFGGSE